MPPESPNATLAKVGQRLNWAGEGAQGPLLAGLASRIVVDLEPEEVALSLKIKSAGFERVLSWEEIPNNSRRLWTTVVHGVDSLSAAQSKRNYLELITTFGTLTRQFWVKDLPTRGAIYVDGQECQQKGANLFIDLDPETVDDYARHASFSINALPNFNDEFFTQGELVANRYATTRRNWGGALTAQVFLDGDEIIEEQLVQDLMGYYWEDPSYGDHTVAVRLRADWGSCHYVTLTGKIICRQLPCANVGELEE